MRLRNNTLALALILFTLAVVRSGEAQSAGGIAIAASEIRHSPVAFPQLVQLNDFGTVTITLTAADMAGTPITFNLISGPLTGSVGPLNSTTGQIQYTPIPGSSSSDSFTFSVSDGILSSEAATVTIFPPLPLVSLSAVSFDMGTQLSGLKGPAQAFTISNTSASPLNIGTVALGGPDAADFAIENSGTCPVAGTLPGGATCTVVLSFAPLSVGSRSATLSITDNALDSPQTVALTGTGTDFSLGAATGGSTSAIVTAGQPTSYSLQINSISGFAGQVSLTCTGAPAGATCSVSPSQVNVAGAAAAFSVSVTTAAAVAAQTVTPPFSSKPHYLAAWTLFVLALIGLLYLAKPRTLRLQPFLSATVLGGALFVISCGGKGNAPPPPAGQPGTPAGTYTLTVAGNVNGATRSTPLTLTVR